MRVSLATRSWESATSMEESWLSIQPLGPKTRATATSCRAVCTADQEELEEARNSPDCAPCCSTIAVSSCKGRPIASRNWRACASKPLPYIHNPTTATVAASPNPAANYTGTAPAATSSPKPTPPATPPPDTFSSSASPPPCSPPPPLPSHTTNTV